MAISSSMATKKDGYLRPPVLEALFLLESVGGEQK